MISKYNPTSSKVSNTLWTISEAETVSGNRMFYEGAKQGSRYLFMRLNCMLVGLKVGKTCGCREEGRS